MLRGIWHYSFTVGDIERSIAFYRDILGFDLIHRQEQANEYTRRLVGYPDAHLKVAQFVVPGQPRGISSHDLELVEYVAPRCGHVDPNTYNPGAPHLAFTVGDVQGWYDRLVASGVTFISPPNQVTEGANTGGYTCYFRDPDDIVLELCQAPPHRLQLWEGETRPQGTYRGIYHFSFTVGDIARSIDFYQGLLGFDLVHEQVQDNAYTRRLVGYPDACLKVAQFAAPGQPRGISTQDLELVEYVRPRGTRGDTNICNTGAGHLAMTVDDIHERYERLSANGVTFVSPPNYITAGVNEGGYTCYFRDPDDIVLEMVQPPASRLQQ